MANLSEIRDKYPQYKDMSDQQFADAFYNKYYSDIPKNEFYKKINYSPNDNNRGFSGIINDIKQGFYSIPNKLQSAYQSLPTWERIKQFNEAFNKEYSGQTGKMLKRLGQKGIEGLLDKSNQLTQVLGNARDYAVEKGFAPESFPSLRLAPKDYDYSKVLGAEGEQAGDVLFKGIGSSIPTIGFGGRNPLALASILGLESVGKNENPIPGILLGLSPSIIGKSIELTPQIAKTAANVGKSTINLPKKIVGKIKEPYIKQKTFAEAIKLGELSTNEANEAILLAKNSIKHAFKKQMPKEPLKSEIFLSEGLKNAAKNLKSESSKLYDNFYHESGKIKISEPLRLEEVNKYRKLASPETKKLIDKSLGSKEITESSIIDPLTKKPLMSQNVVPGKQNVKNLVELSKEIRDESSHLSKQSTSKRITFNEKKDLVKKSNKLKEFKNLIDNKIRLSLSPEQYGKLALADKFYSNMVRPFSDVNILKKAIKHHPEIKSKNFVQELYQSGVPDLVDALLKDPLAAKAISSHRIKFVNPENLTQLTKFLEEDTRYFPKEFINKVKNEHKNIVTNKNIIEELKIELTKNKLSKQEVDKIINKYEKIAKYSGVAAAGKFINDIIKVTRGNI